MSEIRQIQQDLELVHNMSDNLNLHSIKFATLLRESLNISNSTSLLCTRSVMFNSGAYWLTNYTNQNGNWINKCCIQ